MFFFLCSMSVMQGQSPPEHISTCIQRTTRRTARVAVTVIPEVVTMAQERRAHQRVLHSQFHLYPLRHQRISILLPLHRRIIIHRCLQVLRLLRWTIFIIRSQLGPIHLLHHMHLWD